LLNFALPIIIIIGFALGTFFILGTAKSMEAFLLVVILLGISMVIQGIPFTEVMDTFTEGVKGSMQINILMGLAYCLNGLTKDMGAANYIISLTSSFLSPKLIPFLFLIVSSLIAFATGSAWGTLAICTPLVVPMALNATGGVISPFVLLCIGSILSGAIFGDHCSPVSDSTVCSSAGAACDHIDHVKTQMPYAIVVNAISAIGFLIGGFITI
jgi:Na+/H+ antiporter NhaC